MSEREALIVQMAASGLIDRDICDQLKIAPGTLSTYWSRIRHKSGQASRPAITSKFVRHQFHEAIDSLVAHVAETRAQFERSDQALEDLHQALVEVFAGLPILAMVVGPEGDLVAVTRLVASKWGETWAPGASLHQLMESENSLAIMQAMLGQDQPSAPIRISQGSGWYELTLRPLSGIELWMVLARSAWPPGFGPSALVELD
ncbi:MAG: response regulator transcription factor [Fimbriimonadaceae bacterium]|nr:response regulator transcription factor [Fimbriimonadaceae bacterium]